LATIRSRPVELAAVDPQLEGSPSAREIERLRLLFPALPLILYTALTPATAAVLLALGHSGINAVVFTRIDDHPARLREVLAHEEARSASRQLLDQLAAVLAPLPSELRWVVEEMLRAPAELQTVQQVAARARVDRRTFERWFARLRLPSPRHFLAAARVLYAHRRHADHPRAPRGARAHRPGIRPAAPGARLGVMSGTPPHPPSPASRSSTILVVEDDAALRRVLERALVRQGYRVLTAASAETAYELLASEPADAVLLDVQLPTMSGLALYLALIHRHPALAGRIAIMSGDAEADNVRAWLQNNPCTVLKKPFDLRQITEWARELLDMGDRRTGNG